MLKSLMAIAGGAALGAWLRWALGLKLNSWFPSLPPGTVVANFIGAYIIGVAVAFFANLPGIAPEWRLFLITGFCGGLTTFSTFSAETMVLIQQGRLLMALAAITVHVVGSLCLTALGMATYFLFNPR
ncbi:fluoride efflux transporter CrcB [Pseudomonas sp. KNUC1026]|uniref:fluoride efflux transporter CrcB n=1 Tax=Pseudomonas sp. KNUC1026 TaxID=2893890 RepID=UPI001F3D57A5|nr:fluoride efflux transporter CrcB [Pseudomonas sp. KNUC1026]UFH48987.1 fluoride efflux transporter CrcB [Pseudomonas sp. KNUC1026]